ncbi:Echinoidin [Holothuria leucospilota]|uniref:Echinoidin n=1 Tax=Holothuria leucospilota TaxID=206669 RepID=A0A9Q0YLS5_HOLLE|nr:Echinoidin [Holothuria leucospilota]
MASFNSFCLIVLVASLQQITTADRCPPSWISWGHHCYRFELTNKAVWDAAEANCTECGLPGRPSHLVSIHSKEEQNFLYEVFRLAVREKEQQNAWDPSFYIGLLVGKTETDLSWSDGSRVDYRHWYRGEEPNNFPNSGGEISNGIGLVGRWIDSYAPNTFARYYACKMLQN